MKGLPLAPVAPVPAPGVDQVRFGMTPVRVAFAARSG